ncbi:uncharacterized protein [Diadema antillarum]|uniref:uncharacterized protein n=1 Tax=Diadema antillarum TaxID=105358 RepID=UPI003A836D25
MDSSKRALYKPAPIENVGAKQNRSLAQGRLVNDAFIPDSLTVYAVPPSVETTSIDTLTTISHSASQFNSGSLSPARQSLASLNLSHQTPSLSSDLSSPLPRRDSPSHQYLAERNSSPPHSPLKPSPTNILELSDSDREYVGHHRTPIRHIPAATGSPVLLVDASGQHLDSGQAEVEVRTKVNRGYTEEAARVRVDSVPSVTVLGDVDLRRGTSADRSEPPQTGDPTHTGRESTVVPQELTASSKLSSNTESTLTGTLKANETSPQEGPSDAGHEGNASLESERPSSSLSVADDSRPGSTKKKKKVKGKFVQSRYMQSLSKPAPTQASNISTTSRTNRSVSRPTSSTAVSRTDRKKTSTKPAPIRATASFSQASIASSSAHPKARSSSHSRPPASATATGSGASQFNYTPVAKRGKRFASTPAANTSVLPNAPSINASAIAASTSMMNGGDMSAIAPAAVSELGGPHSSVSLSPTHDSAYSSLGNKPINEPTQEDLSVMYARYVQAAFLDTKMRKVITDKEKEAKNQMFALWKENQKRGHSWS